MILSNCFIVTECASCPSESSYSVSSSIASLFGMLICLAVFFYLMFKLYPEGPTRSPETVSALEYMSLSDAPIRELTFVNNSEEFTKSVKEALNQTTLDMVEKNGWTIESFTWDAVRSEIACLCKRIVTQNFMSVLTLLPDLRKKTE